MCLVILPLLSAAASCTGVVPAKAPGYDGLRLAVSAVGGLACVLSGYQDTRFTSGEFIGVLNHEGMAISMDGKGCWRDTVFVERLWRSVMYFGLQKLQLAA